MRTIHGAIFVINIWKNAKLSKNTGNTGNTVLQYNQGHRIEGTIGHCISLPPSGCHSAGGGSAIGSTPVHEHEDCYPHTFFTKTTGESQWFLCRIMLNTGRRINSVEKCDEMYFYEKKY